MTSISRGVSSEWMREPPAGSAVVVRPHLALAALQFDFGLAEIVDQDVRAAQEVADALALVTDLIAEDRALERVAAALGERPEDVAVDDVDVVALAVIAGVDEADDAPVGHDRRRDVAAPAPRLDDRRVGARIALGVVDDARRAAADHLRLERHLVDDRSVESCA